MKAIFLENEGSGSIEYVYKDDGISTLKGLLEFCDDIIGLHNVEKNREFLSNVEYAFSSWGTPSFSESELSKYLPKLKCIFYAAGSVQYFARPFLNKGIKVFSAWAANAVPVAEYTVAQIILANKGYFQGTKKCSVDKAESRTYCGNFRGNYGCNVGIIGAGMIGSLVINMLKSYNINPLVFDLFLSNEKAEQLNVQKCSLEYLFENSSTISNHLANNPQTVGMLNKNLFNLMSDNATFINTGRGAQVVENDLVEALIEKPDRTALLDVTYPEPLDSEHPFLKMDNVFLTPHIAGSMNDEVKRMADYMIQEYKNYISGIPTRYEVTLEMLDIMA